MRGWMALVVALSLGCAAQEQAPREVTPRPAANAVETVRPDGWIRAVRKAHELADQARTPAEIEQAILRMSAAFDQSSEPGAEQPATNPARQDLAGRIAALHLRLEQPNEAAEWIRRGLALEAPPSVFTAHLHLVAARLEEATGQPAEAAASRVRARLINQALGMP